MRPIINRENRTLLMVLNHPPDVSFSVDSSEAWSNEASGLHASVKCVWGRNSGLHDLWQKSTEQARLHSLNQCSHGAPQGSWLRGLYQQIKEVWGLVPRQVMIIASHPHYFRLAPSRADFPQAEATGAAQAEIGSN